MQQSTNVARTQAKNLFILYIVRTSQRGTFNAPVINELTCLSLISSYTYCQYCSDLGVLMDSRVTFRDHKKSVVSRGHLRAMQIFGDVFM